MWGLDDGEKFALGSLDEQQRWQSAYRSMIDAMTSRHGRRAANLRYVGRSLPRNDVLYKVRGKARITQPTFHCQECCTAVFVRSQFLRQTQTH